MDQALPFGLRSVLKLFTAVANAIGWGLVQAGIPFLIHYLDVFPFFVPQSAQGWLVLARILDTVSDLGVPSSHSLSSLTDLVVLCDIRIDFN